MTTGNLPIYNELERALARHFDVESATLTTAGYFAPLIAAQAIASHHSHVLLDERAHACLLDAAAITGLPTARFSHRDPQALASAVRTAGAAARVLVMTDGLFTHSGEVAPLSDYLRLLPRTAVILVDDAHGVGVLGEHGRGTAEFVGAALDRIIVAATLSKAFGCYGGVILGRNRVRERILASSRIFTGNTPVPPPCAVATLAALDVMKREGAERRRRLLRSSQKIKEAVREAHGDVGLGPGPMFSVAPDRKASIVRLSRLLLAAGIHPPLIHYPNGPAPRYFRFALSSEHEPGQLAALEKVLRTYFARGRQ